MGNEKYRLPIVSELLDYMKKRIPLIHILVGPRQTGKSTSATMVAREWDGPVIQASADEPVPPGPEWIAFHWERARAVAPSLLILDEIQKVNGWSEAVKKEWDSDAFREHPVQVLLLGSAALLVRKGLSESLTGRFLLHRLFHWDFPSMRNAFGLSLDEWIYFGGYPGAARLMESEELWRRYIRDSLVETTIARDVLQMEPVRKPTILRHLFFLACRYPAQILSYNKMLGQLVDAGNTTTLSHYVTLLDDAFLITGLESFKPGGRPKRGSSPKLIVRNNALISATTSESFPEARSNPDWWGRLVENAAGLHLLNTPAATTRDVCYWRDRNEEVDFVIRSGNTISAVEVKSSRMRRPAGLRSFTKLVPSARTVIVGESGIALQEFFRQPASFSHWPGGTRV